MGAIGFCRMADFSWCDGTISQTITIHLQVLLSRKEIRTLIFVSLMFFYSRAIIDDAIGVCTQLLLGYFGASQRC